MMKPVAPGADQLGENSAAKPADETVLPPISDDDAGHAPPEDNADGAPPPPDDENKDEQRRPVPQKPPSDQLRDKIAERFSQTRTHTPGQEGNEPPPAEDADAAPAGDETAPADGVAPAADKKDAAPADRLTLKVFGKDQVKSIDEIAMLADMTPDEVRENPERAVKYAQRELATTQRLDEAKRIHRETTSRLTTGDQAPHPEPKEPGTTEKPDQQEQPRPTKGEKVDFKKLVEALQIEDPETAAQSLQQAFEQVAETAVSAARETVSESEMNRRAQADRTASSSAVQEFTNEHPELAKHKYAGKIIAAGLYDEYREDLVKALVAEGTDQDEADTLVKQANDEMVANAHRQRRVKGDPNVRRIDKAMMEKAYGRVATELGIKIDSKPTPKDLVETREARKANLTPQPRRASVPPAANPQAPKPQTRSQAVAELAAARGQKGPSSPR